MSDSWRDVLGWSPEDMVGTAMEHLVDTNSRELVRRAVAQAQAGDFPVKFEAAVPTSSGKSRRFEWRLSRPHNTLLWAVANELHSSDEDRKLAALRAIVTVLSIEFSEPVPVLRSSDSRR